MQPNREFILNKNMSINQKDIAKLSRLSKIEIDEDKKPELAQKISKILDWMAVLNEAETKDVKPLLNVHQMNMPMSKDKVSDGGLTKQVLKNAPNAQYDYFAVPKVIE
ncbi:MAG: aspartyl-tRNA(Asn)/glutamyl-tRNA(Gln) amidotransferase subunit C [Lentimonas sp.]|jgi:aspartyl-tRNA(Asn)/glutamyl-tRNA(Gln) amidotransferase subunit C